MWYSLIMEKGFIMTRHDNNKVRTSSGNYFGWSYWQWLLHVAVITAVFSLLVN